MPRKLSIKSTARWFIGNTNAVTSFLNETTKTGISDEHISWCYDHAVIRLYRYFEGLVLWSLVGSINNDTSTISAKTGFDFPKHLTDEVCFYLVTGPGYFDFRGRNGLISTLKKYLPDDHYLIEIVKKLKYKGHIERLCALRNYAAHESPQSKRAALIAVDQQKMGSAGSWLKCRGRFAELSEGLTELATEIENQAPY